MEDEADVRGKIQMNMVVARFLTKNDFVTAISTIKSTKKLFLDNKNHNNQVLAEVLEILVTNYGEIQSKLPLGSDVGQVVTEHLTFYMKERKKYLV